MEQFLVFSLAASLASMGELAGHERRGTLLFPTRSGLIGMMGAALGIRRDGDFSILDALKIDVAIFDSGSPLRDFHTVQTVPTVASKAPNSRPEALIEAEGNLNTMITLRDYRGGVFYGVAVRGENLDEIANALNKPFFTLYFGRKCCPLSAPPGAKVVVAESSEDAIALITAPAWRTPAFARTLVEEGGRGEFVNDVPVDRQRWHFSSREVGLRNVNIAVGV
ncbi:CRISPR-associated protein Cas5 [Acetobacter malorum DSM 14337]|uniref:CRISPR-associated protein Cas5 n=1 Tax=Acetobacter malorum DSM 14337 TaxID=1307910 RepID=A0ABQ0Q020_9PROT|nr:type I-E CRISPR-associated protein Cas5/CasD [Acetobacter malorum]GBQ85812.1 CRISPR-associated protein Cas5 [Acetobacter malorum DSM 14337]